MSDFRLFIPIGKVDEAARTVYGVLTAEVPDKSGEIFDYSTGKEAFEKWSSEAERATKGKSKGNLRSMHDNIAAGKFTDIVYDDDAKRIEGCAKVIDDAEWQKVLEGVYAGFSIGGSYTKRWKDPENPSLWRYTPSLSEVSLVDNPCCPDATFEVIKADGAREMRLITPSNEDSMTTADKGGAAAADNTQPAADAGTEDALLKAAREADAKGEATEEQKELLAKHADAKPKLIEDGKPVKPKTAVVQKNVWLSSDGIEHPNKRAAEVHELHLEKQVELAPALAKMDALLADAKPEKTAAEIVEKAAPAEEKPEPAKTEEKPTEKAAEPAKTEKSAKAPLKKGLYQIGWLANLLSDLQSLQGSVEFEQMWEQDTSSELPAKFKGLVAEMCQVLVALVDEETSELIEEGQEVDVEVMEMAAKMDAPHAAALAKHVKHEKLKAELEKSGARHSKTDKEALMELHKSACDHVDAMEKCFKGMGVMPEESDDGATKMSKLLDVLAAEKLEKSAILSVLEKTNSTLEKAADRIEGLEKSKSDLAKRVENLEQQPAAGKGHVKAISKAQDNGGTGDGKPTPEKVAVDLLKLSPEERTFILMKGALATPVPVARNVSAQ